MTKTTTDFHGANRASEVLAKIGKGEVDTDFARTIHTAINAAQLTNKKAEVTIKVQLEPDEDRGCMLVRASVSAKIPKLPLPASQMHIGPCGELLSQEEIFFGRGAPSESGRVEPIQPSTSASGRMPVAKAPAPAPLAPAPTAKPLAGKEAAAGEKAETP
jgi:hypothetical protein